jgi:N6-L-threonylcarbamoyladenine synthase
MTKKDILILGIESSCDETCSAVVKNGREILSDVINSQIEIHKRFGGVVPELASRNHTMAISTVCEESLRIANVGIDDIDAIAVTYGAGLQGALLVGLSFAKALAYAKKKPLIAVNHIRGHIASNYIANKDLKPPFICLLVSGGHTAIIEVKDFHEHVILGSTLDDACGEAFDKIARVLGLEYPGGPNIEKLAARGAADIEFPKMLKNSKNKNDLFNFSYSGLKTAVINYINLQNLKGGQINAANIAASFQKSAVDVLIEKAVYALRVKNYDTLCVAGGVGANKYLREGLAKKSLELNFKLTLPPLSLCTDNAAMIAAEGYFSFVYNKNIADMTLNAKPFL